MHKESKLIFLLPNLFTAASLFLGIIAIISASKGELQKAAWLIVLAMLFDGLDGRIARLTGTTSRFGIEFDSLADSVAFGVAPAMIFYFGIGSEYGRFGVAIAALYALFGAIRLAKFNISGARSDPGVFIGLPIPVAALFVIMWTLFFDTYAKEQGWVLLILFIVTSLLLVSNIRYPSFKKFHIDKPNLFRVMIVLFLILILLFLFRVEGLLLLSTLYVFYGPVRAVKMLSTRKGKYRTT